ncbi:hypothetical protein [Saccharibacillus sacchari]|uniref:Uncharacterized protein n=1 Tax=Saccharibacillus sacchari TaxID=456493 RepID=A0ACC6P9V2_9BACL
MPESYSPVVRFGSFALIVSGILFIALSAFLLPVPSPPVMNAEWAGWLERWRFNLSMADELMFFAPMALIPAVFALHRVLAKNAPVSALLGCGILALVVPNYLLCAIALGRLVYPVYGIAISTDMLKLMFSLYAGSQHMTLLVLCAATVCLSLAIWRSPLGRLTAILGFVAAALDLVASYPWLIGNAAMFVTQLFHALWWIWLGVRLLQTGPLSKKQQDKIRFER